MTTFLITQLYVAYSPKSTDPIADEMRGRLEAHESARRDGGGSTARGSPVSDLTVSDLHLAAAPQ